MTLSVVVPAFNAAEHFSASLNALAASAVAGVEIIVVDDASTDGTADIAARYPVRVLRLDRNSGAGAARNAGVRSASGDLVLFVDSDVVVHPGTLARVTHAFSKEPELAAVFGSYDTSPSAPGLVSQFRNLLHHYVHQQGDPDASTFWAGCGAIRRAVFESVGGFDAERYGGSIEDIELGYRLREAGYRIRLDRDLLVTHLKKWTLYSFLRTDFVMRALPWSRLILERRAPMDHLNLKPAHRASVALSLVVVGALALSPLEPRLLIVAGAAAIAFVAANANVLGFFARVRGRLFVAAAVPLLLLHYLASGLAFVWVWLTRPFREPAAR